MNGIDRLRDLVKKAELVGPLQVMPGRTLLHLETGEGNGRGQGEPVCSIPKKYEAEAEFFQDAANARQALSDVLALVEAVGRWRKHGRAPRFDKELMEAYEKLTSADAQEVRE